jgi:hypothetical protein
MEYLYYLRNFNAFHIYLLAASIKHMGIVKRCCPEAFVIHTAACSLAYFNENFNLLKITAFLIGFPALLLILSKPVTKSNKWMYPAAVLVGFESSISF